MITVATVKTGGTAAVDGLAQARGQTPPSQERWRARQEAKRTRGEKPRDDPGGLRRIWRQHTEAAAERAAATHEGKLRYLAEHGDAIAESKKRRMERAARHRQYVGGKLAAAGGSSWNALRTAAQKATEAKRIHDERKIADEAWAENDRRTEDEAHNRNNRLGAVDEDGPDAQILDFSQRINRDGETEVAVTTGDDTSSTSSLSGDPADPTTWRGVDEYGRDVQTGRGPSVEHPDGGVVHDTGTYVLRTESWPRRIVAQHQHSADAESAPESEQQITSTASEGEAMSTPQSQATEITDLPTAHQRATESAQYAGTVVSVLSDQLASLQAAMSGLRAEAQMQESGSGSLSAEGFDSTITGRFDAGAEAFTEAVTALQQQVQAVQAAMDQVETAQTEMKSAAAFFHEQQDLADSIGAQKQRGGVASRTGWYTGA